MSSSKSTPPFFGWRVMWAAFVLAAFGWGFGFYSPPVFLHAVIERTGWPLPWVSAAVTVHFLSGAVVVINLPRLVRTFGTARVVALGAGLVGAGMVGWSLAADLWQLYIAAVATGSGWVTLSAAGINAILAPWFERRRPWALSMAYNGAGVGGALIAPIWAYLLPRYGFTEAAVLLGTIGVVVIWTLSWRYFSVTPAHVGQFVDGETGPDAHPTGPVDAVSPVGQPSGMITPAPRLLSLPANPLRSPAFVTLAAAMALSLFAQIGIVSHLFSMLAPILGLSGAGLTMGAATALSIFGRMVLVWLMPPFADRRVWLAFSYTMQLGASVLLALFARDNAAIAVAATLLFGMGIGNVTSMPPLIAQAEFQRADVLRVISLIVAVSQGISAFAPSMLGAVRQWATAGGGTLDAQFIMFFASAALFQVAAVIAVLAGRRFAPARAPALP